MVETQCLGNRMAGLRYWVTGSDVYRYSGDTVVTLDIYSLFPHSYLCPFYVYWFNCIYHSAILITSKSTVLLQLRLHCAYAKPPP